MEYVINLQSFFRMLRDYRRYRIMCPFRLWFHQHKFRPTSSNECPFHLLSPTVMCSPCHLRYRAVLRMQGFCKSWEIRRAYNEVT